MVAFKNRYYAIYKKVVSFWKKGSKLLEKRQYAFWKKVVSYLEILEIRRDREIELTLFYDTDNIGDETYASIGVYEGTTKNNVLNVVPL